MSRRRCSLGASRGYGEEDVRQNARALTGFRNDWKNGIGDTNFRYDPSYHDPGMKTIFGKHGAQNRAVPLDYISRKRNYFSCRLIQIQ